MFKEYMLEKLSAKVENRLLIFDFDGIKERFDYPCLLEGMGFYVLRYSGAAEFRYLYHSESENGCKKVALIVSRTQYVPYDIHKGYYSVDLSLEKLFPNLNKEAILKDKSLDFDLLYGAYGQLFKKLTMKEDSSDYIISQVYSKENIKKYIRQSKDGLAEDVAAEHIEFSAWMSIAAQKGKTEYLAARSGLKTDLSFVDTEFAKFILRGYSSLSGVTHKGHPAVLVNRVLDAIANVKEKTALIVMDGMSVFDFTAFASDFDDIDFEENYVFAMIPTTTAISRQSLLSGKFPVELSNPFSLSREENEFLQAFKDRGYADNQAAYARGYSPDYRPGVKFLCVIVNDIDDLVHGQTQGRAGMYNDVTLLAKTGRLQKLITKLFADGFTVYLTSDHGNTLCTGLGAPHGMGVEVETKSKRALVLRDFANGAELIEKYNLTDYPGFYLDKQYKYLICESGRSFDVKGSEVMTHGGISIDEVIVPFIKIKAVQNG